METAHGQTFVIQGVVPAFPMQESQYGTVVSIRQTTGLKLLYTTIATVTMNLIVAVAIVLLNLYVTACISYQIHSFVLSVHIPDVSTSICVEVDSITVHGQPFYNKAFVQ